MPKVDNTIYPSKDEAEMLAQKYTVEFGEKYVTTKFAWGYLVVSEKDYNEAIDSSKDVEGAGGSRYRK